MYIQKQSPFWWTRNLSTTIYFLRELTGVFITLYVIYFLSSAFYAVMTQQSANKAVIQAMTFTQTTSFVVISWIGLIAAIFHTITWLWVTVKIAPVPLKKPVAVTAFVALLGVWIVVSYFLLQFLYITRQLA